MSAPLLVEAPGYCPPGPKWLFQPTIYQHSRLPGLVGVGVRAEKLKVAQSYALVRLFAGHWYSGGAC